MTESDTVDPRHAARRRELVAAAYQVFTARGYHASGVADIVRAAGVSHGTFYNYFDNKRDVLDAVLDDGVGRVIDEVIGDDRFDVAEDLESAGAQLRAILGRVFDLLEREPELVEFVLLEAAAIDAELARRVLGLFGRFAAVTQEYVRHGLQRGYLRPNLDPQIASEALLSLLFSVALVALNGPVSAAEREQYIAAVVDFAYAGVSG